MSQYIVSARKYRPSTFESVVGQKALTVTLKNAILDDKLAHAYLFCGPRGVGKTSCARIFAKTVNCTNRTPEGEACNQCESCSTFNEGRSVNIIELDAASNNSVEDIRSLIEQVQTPPMMGQYKVYIIDEVHMLSPAAFNAFLKTLEEPPAHAIFVLATTDKHKVIPTILSRCQIFDFNRISVKDITNHLSYVAQNENVQAEIEALQLIAMQADGGMRDALSVFDQIAGFTQGNITYDAVLESLNILDEAVYFRMLAYILRGDYHKCLLLFDEVIGKGFEPFQIMSGMSLFFRNVLLAQDTRTVHLIETTEHNKTRYTGAAQTCTRALIWNCLRIVSEYEEKYRQVTDKRLSAEVAIIKMAAFTSKDLAIPVGGAGSPLGGGIGGKNPINAGAESSTKQQMTPQQQVGQPTTASSSKPHQTYKNSVQRPTVAEETPTKFVYKYKAPQNSKSIEDLDDETKRKVLERTKKFKEKLTFNLKSSIEEEVHEHVEERPKRDSAFDSSDLISAWTKYLVNQDERIILKQTMKDCRPHIGDKPGEVCVPLYNLQHQEEIESVREELQLFLAEELKNDHIYLSTYMVEDPKAAKPITSKEKIVYFSEKCDWFDLFRSELKLRPAR